MSEKQMVLGVKLAAQLETACIREGFTLEEVDRLTRSRELGRLRGLVRFPGKLSGVGIEVVRTFDLDRTPTVPSGMTIVSNVSGGAIVHREWRTGSGTWIARFEKEVTWSSESEQHQLKYASDRDNTPVIGISGEQWLERLRHASPAPARLLDYFMDDPYMIPHDLNGSWFNGGGTYVFWGTIYADEAGTHHVRCLHTGCCGEVGESIQPVNREWGEHDRAVVFRT